MSRVDQTLRNVQSLLAQRQYAHAVATLAPAIKRDPKSAPLLHALAVAHHQLGDHAKALSIISPLAQKHDVAEVRCTYGTVLRALNRDDSAIAELRRAAKLRPQSAIIQRELATTFLKMNRLEEAIEHGKMAVDLAPGDAQAAGTVLVALNAAGLPSQVYEFAGSILQQSPDDLNAACARAFAGNYLDTVTPEQSFADHQSFGEISRRVASAGRATPPPFKNTRDPARRIRVGFLSLDLRTHSVAFFLEPLLAALDRTQLEIHVFAATLRPDARTERLKAIADVWIDVARQPPAAIAAAVREKSVDILIDLGGLTSPHLIAALEYHAAPIQATYLGYPNTTGMASVGYRFVDSHTDPPGAERFCTERLIRLDPCFLAFQPPDDAPRTATGIGPSARGAPITFASFNVLQKISDTTIGLWSRVLSAVPGSRLLLKTAALGDEKRCEALRARLVAAGIGPDRVDILGRTDSLSDHFATYERADIALDTFPYHGTTTTCDALWMGVPVVTLVGQTHASRVGASLLNAVGLAELTAATETQYVQIAASLAADRAWLAELRATLRDRLLASPLCDGAGLARRLEAALRSLWSDWCQTQDKPANT